MLGDIEGDGFGKVYEYFRGKFAIAQGANGGEYFTPMSIVRLIVEIIEPLSGRILDPACGSGGMFVQSARSWKSIAAASGIGSPSTARSGWTRQSSCAR